MNNTKRNYSLDILRIISMLMIITLHYCNFGYHIYTWGTIGYNTPTLWLITSFCYIAVNLFVLISGYFLFDSKFKWKKVLKLWVEVLFYSIIIGLIFFYKKEIKFDNYATIRDVFFPILSNKYWFISTYLIMYVLSPFMNKGIRALEQKEHKRLLIIFGVIILILNEFFPGTHLVDKTYGYGIIWFSYLYLVGAYVKRFDLPKIPNILYLISYILFSLITFGSRYLIINHLYKFEMFNHQSTLLFSYTSITMFFSAFSLFMFFKNLKLKVIMSKLVSLVSVSTFGVYLIHENYLVREVLYEKILKVPYYSTQSFQIKSVAMIVSILAVFAICSIIDIIRQQLFKIVKL